MEQAVALFGSFDENIKLIENEYTVNVVGRGSEIKVSGEPPQIHTGRINFDLFGHFAVFF